MISMEILSQEEIKEIRASADIVNIISGYIPLTAHGKNYFCVCPFHDDKNPSMSVSKEKQIYKCFSCGETGNVFTFVQKYENVSFLEAVKMVAEKIGRPLHISIKKEVKNTHKELYEIYNLSLKLYQNNIQSSVGIEAKEYLKKRQITEDIIKEFDIGLSIKSRNLLTDLCIKKGYSYEDMQKTGLFIKNEYGYSDIYSNRIMFPLYDVSGQVVAYSGRIYNEVSNSKYINTKETEIFKKGELLYNYHRAKESARSLDTIIIMEGFMDVIRAYTIGVKNCVATMGTAVTKNQALLMKRLAKNIILLFDGDEAGEKATEACSKELLNIGVTPKIVRLEEDLDPDEYILKYGQDSFKTKLSHPMSVMDFKLGHYKKNKNLNQNEDKAKYIKEVLKELDTIDDEILREVTLTKISDEMKIDVQILRNQLTPQKKEEMKLPIIEEKTKYQTKYQKAEKYLLYYMLSSSEVIELYLHKVKYLPTEKYRSLARSIVQYYNEFQTISYADFITSIYNDDYLLKAADEINSLNLKQKYSKEEIDDYVKTLEEYNQKEQIKQIENEIKKEIDISKQVELLQKIVNLRGERND